MLLALLPLLFLAVTVSADAKSLIVPLTRKATGSLQGLAKQERLRFGGKAYSPARRAVPAKYSLWAFYATIGIGSPVSAVNYDLVIDTGSANTWVGAGKTYKQTSTSEATGSKVHVSWADNTLYMTGKEYIDMVNITSDLVIKYQAIGVASDTAGFHGYDGVLGLGPVSLTDGTTSGKHEIPTVTDTLFKEGTISANTVSLALAPATNGGSITFGAVDGSLYVGNLTWAPITSTYPANGYWGLDASIAYGGRTLLNSVGAIDTGSSFIHFPTDVFNKYRSATGAVLDSATSLLRVTSAQYDALQPLDFVIAGQTFSLTANGQIWPRSLNTAIGGTTSKIYLVVTDSGKTSGKGLDIIFGLSFLERFFTAYDTAAGRIGLAQTTFTNATTN
ncbi:aspartic protease [Exidia glandulosa HHB12029]|uniref:Aspartic protease n=1 Tax=Exidia glandulosa HHB12029 TaxID=1314781 RepID=A0A165BBK6_EXIGL|nr:aspartic protease [Exidia glandulosa HHB12029]